MTQGEQRQRQQQQQQQQQQQLQKLQLQKNNNNENVEKRTIQTSPTISSPKTASIMIRHKLKNKFSNINRKSTGILEEKKLPRIQIGIE